MIKLIILVVGLFLFSPKYDDFVKIQLNQGDFYFQTINIDNAEIFSVMFNFVVNQDIIDVCFLELNYGFRIEEISNIALKELPAT